MVRNSAKQCKVVPHSAQQCKVVPNSAKLCLIVQSNATWCKVVQRVVHNNAELVKHCAPLLCGEHQRSETAGERLVDLRLSLDEQSVYIKLHYAHKNESSTGGL